ncbi:hypothetical protein [Chromobacterium violaceum]|uniref:hypothetical protein n=1 Tax=Chromobacterium violaceum TaxID=536 RepID=UPI0012D2E8AF|nr:hypothetical protein [Chromobacterium violaceum]
MATRLEGRKMSLRFRSFLALIGVTSACATIWLVPEQRFWLFVISGLLLSPLWAEFSDGRSKSGEDNYAPQRSLFNSQEDFYLSSNNSSDYWGSSDPKHISNGGSNLVEWSD